MSAATSQTTTPTPSVLGAANPRHLAAGLDARHPEVAVAIAAADLGPREGAVDPGQSDDQRCAVGQKMAAGNVAIEGLVALDHDATSIATQRRQVREDLAVEGSASRRWKGSGNARFVAGGAIAATSAAGAPRR